MQKGWKIILVISIIVNIAFTCTYFFKEESQIDSTEFIERIDSLESICDSLKRNRDTIEIRIRTIDKEIEVGRREYEETRNTIINNSINDDYLFFINYLESYRERLDSINNIYSAKGN